MIKIGIDSVKKDTAWYLSMVNEQDIAKLAEQMVALKYPDAKLSTALFKFTDTTWLGSAIERARIVNPRAQFAVDADKRIKYKWVELAVNEMRKKRATTFNFVTEKKTGGM
jgi:biopolymer transport protein ExbD